MTRTPRTTVCTRIASLALATLLTLATLAGVDSLARVDAAAPQLAQAGSSAG